MKKYTIWILFAAMLVGLLGAQAEDDWQRDDNAQLHPLGANLGSELGILDLAANGGINPATSNAWQHGDSYRLVFLSSAKIGGYGNTDETWNHIARWNQEAQNFAVNATNWSRANQLVVSGVNGRGVKWNIIGSTADVDARDNTSTNPELDGLGHAILKLDGTTIVANNFSNLWSGTIQNIIDLTENKNITASSDLGWPYTGTTTNGVATTAGDPWVLRNITINEKHRGVSQGDAANASGWIDRSAYASTAATQLSTSIYGMSGRLFVIDRTDAVAPGLVSFTNNVDGGSILFPGGSIVYTVTFDEAILPNTLTTSVFANAQSTDIRISGVRQLEDPAVFEVTVLPLDVGSIQLQIKAGAAITDLNGHPLDTGTALSDPTVITVEPGPSLTYAVTFETDGTPGAALAGATSQFVLYGSNATPVTAAAPSGFNFINWTLGGEAYSADLEVTVTNVTASVTLVANYLAESTIRIVAASASKIYDGTQVTTNGFTRWGPLTDGHRVSSVTITGSQMQVGTSSNVAADTLIQDAADANVTGEYTILYDAGTLTVIPATLTVTADGQSKIYDGSVFQSFTATTNGFVNAEDESLVSGDVTFTGAAVTATHVGAYAITPVVSALSADNYTFMAADGVLAITQAEPSVTWPTASEIVTGKTLGRSDLMQGAASGVLGESLGDDFRFVLGTGTVVSTAAEYAVAFSPSDSRNYMSMTGTVHVPARAPTETTAGARETKISWFDQFDLMPADAGVETFEQLLGEDSDGNDMSNWQEYIAGTDPTDPESTFRVLGVVIDPEAGTTTVNWYGGTNGPVKPYIVQALDSLSGETLTWATLVNEASRAQGTNIWQGAVEGNIRFFRILATPDVP